MQPACRVWRAGCIFLDFSGFQFDTTLFVAKMAGCRGCPVTKTISLWIMSVDGVVSPEDTSVRWHSPDWLWNSSGNKVWRVFGLCTCTAWRWCFVCRHHLQQPQITKPRLDKRWIIQFSRICKNIREPTLWPNDVYGIWPKVYWPNAHCQNWFWLNTIRLKYKRQMSNLCLFLQLG